MGAKFPIPIPEKYFKTINGKRILIKPELSPPPPPKKRDQ